MTVESPEPALPGFKSLAELQENHARLAQDAAKDVLAPANMPRIIDFVRNAVFTGLILDASADRATAQSLITFWTSRVAAALRDRSHKELWVREETAAGEVVPGPELSDTLLADFNPDSLWSKVIEPADRWWKLQPALDQNFVKRILLRLVRLREKDNTFEVRPSAASVCDDLEPRDQAERVLQELIKLGVVRTVRTDAGQDEVALRSPTLLERWDLLKKWQDSRKEFRKKAIDWAKHHDANEANAHAPQSFGRRVEAAFRNGAQKVGALVDFGWRTAQERLHFRRHSEELLTEEEFEEAETYRDRIPDELKLTYQKRLSDKQRNEKRQTLWVGFAGTSVVFAVLAGIAIWGWVSSIVHEGVANEAAEKAAKQEKVAIKQRTRAQLSLLSYRAESIVGANPQRGVLLALEAMRRANDAALESPGDFADVAQKAEETFAETLSNLGGMGFYADIGQVTHVVAHESEKGKKRELQRVAAAGANGSIALWELNGASKRIAEILPSGASGRIARLFFTRDGEFLVAVNAQFNIRVWDLNDRERRFCAIESPVKNPEITPIVPAGDWLAFDDRKFDGALFHFGKNTRPEGFRKIPFELEKPKGATPWTRLINYSFSQDERWFARFTDQGDGFIWDLDGKNPKPMPLRRKSGKFDGYPVNGEFMDTSKRLVMFLSSGKARYWDLVDAKNGEWEPEEVALIGGAGVITNQRGTHAILISSDSTDKANPKRTVTCFAGKDLDPMSPAGQKLADFDDLRCIGRPEVDATGRWLFARFYPDSPGSREFFRIWDLRREKASSVPIKPIVRQDYPAGIIQASPTEIFSSIALLGNDNTVRVFDLPMLAWRSLQGLDAPVSALGQNQEGRYLLAGALDGSVRVWNLNPYSPSVEPFIYQSNRSHSIIVTPDRRWMALSLPDHSLHFKPILMGRSIGKLTHRFSDGSKAGDKPDSSRHYVEGEILRFAPEHQKEPANLTSIDGDFLLEQLPLATSATLWDLRGETPEPKCRLDIGKDPIIRILARKNWLAIQTWKNYKPTILLWNLSGVPASSAPQRSIDGELVGLSKSDRLVIRKDQQLIQTLAPDVIGNAPEPVYGAEQRISYATVTPDGTCVIVSEYNPAKQEPKTLLIDIESKGQRELNSFDPDENVYFSANGRYLGNLNRTRKKPGEERYLCFWDLQSAKGGVEPIKFQASDSKEPADRVALSDNHRWLVTREMEKAYLWDLDSTLEEKKPHKELGNIDVAKFTADSSWMITVKGGTLTSYALTKEGAKSHKELGNIGFKGQIVCAAISADGMRLAVVGQERKIRLWDLSNEKNSKPRILAPGPIVATPNQMVFAEDGTRVYSFYDDALRVSNLDLDELKKKAAEAIGRNLPESEWRALDIGEYKKTFPELP